MAFNPTDFPCPVAPAISKWGIFARSATNGSEDIVLPIATGNSNLLFTNCGDVSMVFIDTIWGLELGTSIPMVPFPGMGAIILIPKAERLRAMSSSKFFILFILVPGAGTISYKVTVGPGVAFILTDWMPSYLPYYSRNTHANWSSWWLTRRKWSCLCTRK